jgi:hypothetical protein
VSLAICKICAASVALPKSSAWLASAAAFWILSMSKTLPPLLRARLALSIAAVNFLSLRILACAADCSLVSFVTLV